MDKNKNKAQSVAVLIGLRTQESLNRYISMTRDTTSSMYNRLRFSKKYLKIYITFIQYMIGKLMMYG